MKPGKNKRARKGVAAPVPGLTFTPHFMCYVEGSHPPNKLHTELGEAMNEAERLCRKENKPVYVLRDIYRCEPTAPPVLWREVMREKKPCS
jgi:hypothetical protein